MKRIYFLTPLLSIMSSPGVYAAGDAYNPAMSLILDGRYSDYSVNPAGYSLPGFQPGEEAGLESAGFVLGESEITLSSNIDSYFYGQATLAFADSAAVEEAYIQSVAIGDGFTLKFGRFRSSFGYLNAQHPHAWDFADAPLMYRALFANALKDDGLQINYLLPADLFIQISTELFSGNTFPAGGNIDGGVGASTLSLTIGGDIGTDHAWLLGVSHWQARNIGERVDVATNTFSGDSKINALHAIYKWSPNGNAQHHHLKLQMEYFKRAEDGLLTDIISNNTSTYRGDQTGGYAQAIYQFRPRWQTGLRLDQLTANNTGDDLIVLNDTGLLTNGHHPQRSSVMIAWLPSEFSRIRLQYNADESAAGSTDKQIFVQYTYTLGAHGAHQF